jgi:multicomponent Na+:H+ antiporter subunit F
MTVVVGVCVALLAVAALLLVVRISRGPTMLDRVVALDVLDNARYVSSVIPGGSR